MANSPGTTVDPALPDPGVQSGAMLRRGLRLIRTLVALHPWPFSVGVAGATVYALATVGQAWVLGRVIDRVVAPAFERGDVATGTVVAGVLALIAVGVVKTVGVVTRRVGAGLAGTSIEATLRERLAGQYHRLPLRYHREHAAGDLLSRAEGDLVATTHVIHPLPFGTGVLTMVVATTVWLIATDPFLALVGLTVLPIVLGLNLLYQRLVERPVALGQRRLGEVSAVAHESFDGALVVKALHAEAAEGARFERAAKLLRDARLHAARIQAGFEASLDAIPALGAIALLVVGAWRIQQGAVTAGTVVALVNLFVLLIWPLRVIGFVLSEIPRAVAGYDRVSAVLDAPLAGDATVAAEAGGNGELADQRLPARSLDLEVEHLCFSYEPGVEVLHDVTFRVQAGCTVALVGPTGGGKTTLALLLAGLLEPDKGSIKLGGHPLDGLARGEVSGAVALAFQEPFLFSTSIAENIRLTGTGGRDAVADAARLAQVEEFVRRLPRGYDTVVGERGATLSGGQRQRVALARALARRPRLLVLDDATASLDPVTEQKILTGLARHLPVMTTVVVASRLATIALADHVIYLEGGCVAGNGTHDELLAGVPGYAALVRAYEEQSA